MNREKNGKWRVSHTGAAHWFKTKHDNRSGPYEYSACGRMTIYDTIEKDSFERKCKSCLIQLEEGKGWT